MDIKMFCNSNCQSSRGYELIIDAPFVKGQITRVEIPDSDLNLSCEDFKSKYGTDKFPFMTVNNEIIPFDKLGDFTKNAIKSLLSTFKVESVS